MSALFTGKVTVPDVAAGLEKTSAIMQNASSLRAAQQKAKAAAYKRLEAKRTALSTQLFGDSAWGDVPESIRPTVMQGVGEYRDLALTQMGIPGGVEFGETIANAIAFLESAGADNYAKQRGAYIEGIGDANINTGKVIMKDYTEEGLALQDRIHRLTGATSRLGHDDQGNPTILVTEQGSETEVDHRQTQAYMGTSPYQPGVSMRSAISDQDIADRYLGDYQQEAIKFNDAQYNSDFRQYWYNEKGELNTAENMSVDSPEGGLFWKLTNKMAEMSKRDDSGLPPLEANLETYTALSSGDPNHPINGTGFKNLVPKAIDEISESVKAVARDKFDVTGRAPSAATTGDNNREQFLDSASKSPEAIPFVNEQGDTQTLYGVSFTHKRLGGITNISIDNSKRSQEWDQQRDEFINAEIDAKIESVPRNFSAEVAGDDAAKANISALTEHLGGEFIETNGERPLDEIKITKVQSVIKAWDPVAEEYKLFVKGPKSDTKVGGQVSQGQFYYLPSDGEFNTGYNQVDSSLRNDFKFKGGFSDDDLQGGKGYEPPADDSIKVPIDW